VLKYMDNVSKRREREASMRAVEAGYCSLINQWFAFDRDRHWKSMTRSHCLTACLQHVSILLTQSRAFPPAQNEPAASEKDEQDIVKDPVHMAEPPSLEPSPPPLHRPVAFT
jgi:hypothetical protein